MGDEGSMFLPCANSGYGWAYVCLCVYVRTGYEGSVRDAAPLRITRREAAGRVFTRNVLKNKIHVWRIFES
jgi:hypothetical protein